MASVKLLRVEKEGEGMYGSMWFDLCLPTEPDKHPAPVDDWNLWQWWMAHETKDTFFAFANTQQFLQWVYDPEWRYKMQELGGELWVYEVESDGCAIGEKQAIFNINSVLSKRAFPITSFDDPTLRPVIGGYLQS